MKKVFRTIKAPLKFIYHVGSSPVKFVSNKQKKLIKVVTSSNIRVVAVKISRTGKNIIFTIAFIVIARSGIEDRTIVERSYNFSQKAPIERIFQIPYGGAVNHIWSPGVKYGGNSSKISNNKALRRRLLSLPDSNSRSNSGQQLPNHVYKSAP